MISKSAKSESSLSKLSGAASYVRGTRGEALGISSKSAKEGGGLLFELGGVRAEKLGGSLLFESEKALLELISVERGLATRREREARPGTISGSDHDRDERRRRGEGRPEPPRRRRPQRRPSREAFARRRKREAFARAGWLSP